LFLHYRVLEGYNSNSNNNNNNNNNNKSVLISCYLSRIALAKAPKHNEYF